jgi:large subunit ribosomal protein L7/L12
MSQVTDEILEKLKVLTLLEAAELVSQIEEAFGVDAADNLMGGIVMRQAIDGGTNRLRERTEKTTFDVVLESIADDKRVATLKVIRGLTDLGLKEAKDFCSSLPKTMKDGVSKEEAEVAKKELEGAGAKVTLK